MSIDLSKVKLTKEDLDRKEAELIAAAKYLLTVEKLRYYSESLMEPWRNVYAGEVENPDVEEIVAHPGKWLLGNPLHPKPYKAFAHKWQRMLTYPFEWPELLERWKQSMFFIYFAGNRGGKSVCLVNFGSMLIMGLHPLQTLGLKRKPPLHGWVVSPNLPSESDVPRGEDAPILKKFYEWLPDMEQGSAWGIRKYYRKDRLMATMDKEGHESVINFKSLDQDLNKFKSEDVDFILWDEDPKSKVLWDEGKMRLIDRNGLAVLAMTPDYDSVFSYRLRTEERNNPSYFIIDGMGAEDNPFLSKKAIAEVMVGLSDEERQMKAKGLHVQFHGKVFKKFDRVRNVGEPFVPSRDTTQFVVIDWHPVKAIVITYLSVNMKGTWYVFAESAIQDHRVELVAREYFQKMTLSTCKLTAKRNIIDKIAGIDQIQDGMVKPVDIIDMLKKFGIRINRPMDIGGEDFAPAHAELERKFQYQELYFSPKCLLHIDQFDTWGAKRYQKGNLEGTIRDQMEGEGNDSCVNLIYAHNAGCKFDSSSMFEDQYEFTPKASTSRIYGRRGPDESLVRQTLRKEAEKEGSVISWP